MPERNFWENIPAASGMSYNARTSGPLVPRNYRLEWPAWNESVCFADQATALRCAREWAAEDKVLVLVWDFAAAMYIQRYDGREKS